MKEIEQLDNCYKKILNAVDDKEFEEWVNKNDDWLSLEWDNQQGSSDLEFHLFQLWALGIYLEGRKKRMEEYNFLNNYKEIKDTKKLKKEIKRLRERIDQATDEIAEILADYDLSDEELIEVRDTTQFRLDNAQTILLYGEQVERMTEKEKKYGDVTDVERRNKRKQG